jgi:hypothetical protein
MAQVPADATPPPSLTVPGRLVRSITVLPAVKRQIDLIRMPQPEAAQRPTTAPNGGYFAFATLVVWRRVTVLDVAHLPRRS